MSLPPNPEPIPDQAVALTPGAAPSDAGTSNVSDLELRDLATSSELGARDRELGASSEPSRAARSKPRSAVLPSANTALPKAGGKRRVRWQLLPSPSGSPAPQVISALSREISAASRDVGDRRSVEAATRFR